jgi:4-amino-4-deoxy-L-arabinose transferase-like glycosyltransferase
MSESSNSSPLSAGAVVGAGRRSSAVAASRRTPHPALLAVAVVLAITLIRLAWLAASPADLYPDEAQYWSWAQHPAFGYYSKPPLIAWLIALTTGAFGDGEFAIRLAAPLLHAVVAWFVYLIAARLYDRRIGMWSAIAYASLPGVSLSAFIISTDAVLLPFWAAALYAFIRAREPGGARWWIVVGATAGCGLLAKYAMAYWLLSAFGFVLLVPGERRWLWPLVAAALLALAISSPNLWWNAQHGFASYLHVRDNADVAGLALHPQSCLEFFAAQFGVFGPLGFAALIAITATGGAFAGSRARLLAIFAVPTLIMMLAVSLLSHAEPNWAAPTYVSATVLVVAWALGRRWQRAVAWSLVVNLAGAAALFGGPAALAAAGIPLPARYDPLHRLEGWHVLAASVAAALAQHRDLTLVADDRELLAALVYYVHPHPWNALKWNPMRLVKDEWDLSDDLKNHRGESFLVVDEHYRLNDLRPAFAAVEPLEDVTISPGPDGTRTYRLFIAQDFLGYPADRR